MKKIFITHPIPDLSLYAGMTYDLPDAQADEIIKQDKGYEIAPAEKPAPRKVKKEAFNGNG